MSIVVPKLRLGPVDPPAYGIYPDVPMSVYSSWDAMRSTSLKKLAEKTPAHFRQEIENPGEPTPALILGDAIHAAALQPDRFDSEFAVAGPCSGMTKERKPCSRGGAVRRGGSWFCK